MKQIVKLKVSTKRKNRFSRKPFSTNYLENQTKIGWKWIQYQNFQTCKSVRTKHFVWQTSVEEKAPPLDCHPTRSEMSGDWSLDFEIFDANRGTWLMIFVDLIFAFITGPFDLVCLAQTHWPINWVFPTQPDDAHSFGGVSNSISACWRLTGTIKRIHQK